MSTPVVVATSTTDLREGGDRLLELVGWLRRRDVGVEIVALGEGWDLDRFRATGPTLVVDELRRRGPARPAHAAGLHPLAAGIKSVRLRRWLRRRADHTFFVHHPLAASLLRYLPAAPRRVVAGLPDASWRLEDLREEDRASLAGAAGWVVATNDQRDVVAAATGRPVEVLGELVDPAALPPVDRPRPGEGAVALVGAADPWDTVDQAAELAWLLHRERPGTPLRWLVSDERAEWLARHDVDHAGLAGAVEVVRLGTPGALAGLGAVVRTSLRPAAEQELVAAGVAGLPVLDLADPAMSAAARFAPLALEDVVAAVCKLVDDPAAARSTGRVTAERLPLATFEHRADAVLRLLQG